MPLSKFFSVSVAVKKLAYDETPLFENIKFNFEKKEWTCLLGASGVGKTTLLRLIANLIPNIHDATIECSDKKPLENRISYMAQQDLLMPWLNVLENVLLGYKLRSEWANKSLAIEIINQVGLSKNIHDLPAKLSGGMRQRVALARTLMEDRPFVLMDEPFSRLDAITRIRMQDLTANLLKNCTVLLVTHDPLEALRLADKINVLSGRPVKLNQTFSPDGKRPRDLRTPQLLQEQVNLLELLASSDQSRDY